MNKILKNRLNDCKIDAEEIVSHIKSKEIQLLDIYIYTSHLEGLGTKSSDFDIYVIGKEFKNLGVLKYEKGVYTENIIINDTLIDIEYRELQEFKNVISRINNMSLEIDLNELKFLDKLSKGISLFSQGENLKNNIDKNKILKRVEQYYTVQANSYFRDAMALYYENEYTGAIFCARNALEHAIGILNAKNGISNVKYKWISKLFLNNEDIELSYINRYLNTQIYVDVNKDNISNYIEEMLELVQEIISSGTIKS